MVEPPLAEVKAGESATGLIQAEGVLGAFRELDGFLTIADAVGKLA